MPIKRPIRRRRKPVTPRWWTGRRLTAYGKQAISVLVLVGTLFLRERQPMVPTKRDEEEPPGIWVVDVRSSSSIDGMSRPMPVRPATKEQMRPPCNGPGDIVRYAEVNGACWLEVVQRPPCGELYEHTGRCFVPVTSSQRPPTSITP